MPKQKPSGTGVLPASRRDFMQRSGLVLGGGALGLGAGQAIALTGGSADAAAAATAVGDAAVIKPLDYHNNYWNRDALARIMGDLDFGKQKFGWYRGVVKGVRHGQKNRDLVGFEGFSFTRLQDNGNGTYNKLLREVGYYTDLKTGDVLEEWHNPYTDEKVPVVHIANDPFNFVISAFFPKPPAYGGLNKEKRPDIPMILPWTETSDGNVFSQNGIDLYYPAALQPDKWPRESSGKMSRVSEMFNYVFRKEDLADPEVTGLQFSGSWHRVTPWLPWMLMGQSEGHVLYNCIMGCYDSMDILSPKIRAYAEKHHPEYFNAPTKWEEPSLSSLEHYAREQTPAPVKKQAK